MVVPEGDADGDVGSTAGEHERVPDGSVWSLTGERSVAFRDRDPERIDDATALYLLDRHAASDGTVTVQLLGWERDGDVVRVEYALPTGERLSDRYRWPTPGRYADSDFLALVCELGYAPAAADLVAGEFARARVENDRWRIVTGRAVNNRDSTGVGRRNNPIGENTGDAFDTDEAAGATTRSEMRRRLRRADPMSVGSVAVGLLFLAVMLPAVLAVAVGGVATWIAVIGAALFGASLTALGLSIAAVV